jgi:hypothetical protein
MVQLTGVLGQLGTLASAAPLVVLLRDVGWTPTFVGAAGLGLAAVLLVGNAARRDLAVRDPEAFAADAPRPGGRRGRGRSGQIEASHSGKPLSFYPCAIR